jgi:hypothetical protein
MTSGSSGMAASGSLCIASHASFPTVWVRSEWLTEYEFTIMVLRHYFFLTLRIASTTTCRSHISRQKNCTRAIAFISIFELLMMSSTILANNPQTSVHNPLNFAGRRQWRVRSCTNVHARDAYYPSRFERKRSNFG